jgi:phosphotriesterase-related protein
MSASRAALLLLLLPSAALGQRRAGRVITVTGDLDPDSVGITLMHEHLASNLLVPEAGTGYNRKGPPTPLFVRRFQETGRYYRVARSPEALDVFVLDDTAATLDELATFRRLGGNTLVDVTTVGIGRDPVLIREYARRSGVHVVMATGWYRWMYHPPEVARKTVDDLARIMEREITTGVGSTGIRAGIIGEIPLDAAGIRLEAPLDSVYPDSVISERVAAAQARIRSGRATPTDIYDPEEIKVLRAAARASRRTGAAITLHAPDPWIDYLDILEQEGADLHRVVIGHADQVILDTAMARRALDRGVYLQLDYTLQRYAGRDTGPFDQLLDQMAWAVRAGYGSQLLLSLDLCFRMGLTRYGGGGYATLFDRIIPGLEKRGLSEAQIRTIVADNPRRVLTITAR